jgi:hypothetical protein
MQLNSKVYDVLKFIAQILLPGAGALYFALAGIWSLPASGEVTGTVIAVDTFLGVLLGFSSASYNKSDAKYDGAIGLEPHPDGGQQVRLQGLSEEALLSKPSLTLKINSPAPSYPLPAQPSQASAPPA